MASASLLTVFAVFQAPPNVEPPWRNDRALVRRDSLNIRWTIPHSEPPVLYVELEHDGGFGGTSQQLWRSGDGMQWVWVPMVPVMQNCDF